MPNHLTGTGQRFIKRVLEGALDRIDTLEEGGGGGGGPIELAYVESEGQVLIEDNDPHVIVQAEVEAPDRPLLVITHGNYICQGTLGDGETMQVNFNLHVDDAGAEEIASERMVLSADQATGAVAIPISFIDRLPSLGAGTHTLIWTMDLSLVGAIAATPGSGVDSMAVLGL